MKIWGACHRVISELPFKGIDIGDVMIGCQKHDIISEYIDVRLFVIRNNGFSPSPNLGVIRITANPLGFPQNLFYGKGVIFDRGTLIFFLNLKFIC